MATKPPIEKLMAIAKFIALDKPTAADKWVNDVFDRTDLLGSQPELGQASLRPSKYSTQNNTICSA
tara:strand:+ start:2058 stop:2255 length:198 start_codon:yes stop_codon:yes gene_type:complete